MNDGEVDFGRLIALLRRQIRVIVIALVVGLGATTLVVFSLTPIYSATALVVVDPRERNLLDPTSDFAVGAGGTARVASELEIMRSDAVLLRVIEREGLVRDEEFGARLGMQDRILAFLQIAQPVPPSGDAALRQVLRNLRSAFSANQIGLSNVIGVSAKSADREKAARLANTWAEVHIENQILGKIESTIYARDVIEARLDEARASLVAAESSLDGYIDNNLAQIVGETGRADISSMGNSLQQLVSDRNLLSSQAEQAQAGLAQRNWSLLTESLGSEALQELERQRERFVAAIENAVADEAVDLRSELADVEQRLERLGQQEIERLRQSIASSQAREADTRERLRSTVLGSSLPPEMLAQIFELQQNAELGRRQYQTLLSRTRDLDAQATLQVADGRVVSPALAPDRPAFPNIGLSLVGALVVSLGAGVALAFLRENVIGGLLTEGQAQDVLNIRVVAAIPRVKAEGDAGTLADIMVESPFSPFSEAVRRIRVAIAQARNRMIASAPQPDSQRGLVVMVTSSTANEGKSTIALSLARANAAADVRVCVVDCDLRHPSIHKMLRLPGSNSLSEYLSSSQPGTTDEPMEQDTLSNAIAILGGERPDLPTDHIVGGLKFSAMIQRLSAEFDVVILDAPPVGPVADGLYIAALSDVVLFVVRSGSTSQTEARLALASLSEAASPDTLILGVLNGQDQASAQYKGAYRGYYYGRA